MPSNSGTIKATPEIHVGIICKNECFPDQISNHLPGGSCGQTILLGNPMDTNSVRLAVEQNSVDVLLLHLAPEVPLDINLIRQLLEGQHHRCPLLIVADDLDAEYYARLLRMGVHGCLLTKVIPSELANAIESIYHGQRFVCRQIRDALAYRYIDKLCEAQSTNYAP